ncbi:phospholipid-translocating ATPase [Geosmithia morbida]|uniref:Phospholipid-transporting ATPase n=1 Tax=Geosmithia morbida TaxID=1094350 RepID=A0A9P4YS68_9HYPO|nr:phospholipid-translocating ATPase [Geosmithia morbida]KAF4120671.1 phospholipid-translocating ATPase [Geosmithia morbida]
MAAPADDRHDLPQPVMTAPDDESRRRYPQHGQTPSEATSANTYQQQQPPPPLRADDGPSQSTERLSAHPDSAPAASPVRADRTGAAASSVRERFAASMERRKRRKMARKMRRPTAATTFVDRLRRSLAALYQLVVIQTILRRRPLPASEHGRVVPLNPDPSEVGPRGLLDERRGHNKPFISNFIRSSRYTLWTFVPSQLVFQFSKLGNFYFLVVGIIQLVPGLSTVGRWTTIAPLGVFVALSMAKEGYDDWRRYQLDKSENRSPAWVLSGGVRQNPQNRPTKFHGKAWQDDAAAADAAKASQAEEGAAAAAAPAHHQHHHRNWLRIQWQHVQVGDVVRLHRDDPIPADIALLHATGPNGIAYIDTMALDGETNLKSKQACPLFLDRCATMDGLRSTKATVVSEDPNIDLYSYEGKATVDGETLPLTMNNVVYRGSTLRNTTMAIGLVINSGEECKIRMNANKDAKAKKPRMQSSVNRMILVQIVFMLALSAGLTGGYYLWKDPTEDRSFYLDDASVSFGRIFFGYIVMFNVLIPISLYISLEIVKVGQYLLLQDADMYDPISDTPAVVNTTTILENLGQVEYVFSDKTGTLTENVMRFRKMSVVGLPFLHDMNERRDREARQRQIESTQRPRDRYDLTTWKGRSMAAISWTVHKIDRIIQEKGYDERVKEEAQRAAAAAAATATEEEEDAIARADSRPSDGTPGAPAPEPQLRTEDLLDILQRKPNSPFARKAKHFLLCIALCHTCLPELKEDGRLEYQAANPDELALVEAARDLGLIVVDRPVNAIKLQTTDPDTGATKVETYEVLDVIEFSSKRKRMSIIVRMPDGRICVICKGADNVIRERLKLRSIAEQKAEDVSRAADLRRSVEQERALQRRSFQGAAAGDGGLGSASRRSSLALSRRNSYNPYDGRRLAGGPRLSSDMMRLSRPDDLAAWVRMREDDGAAERSGSPRASLDVRGRSPRASVDVRGGAGSRGVSRSPALSRQNSIDQTVDESAILSDGAVFERCFQQVDDFASEGLRTLLYGFRYVDEPSYAEWKEVYHEAETSLVDRRARMEEASDLIEQNLDLVGATAIEDKLQDGVPDTIDKLRRANIKVWMLTGDKRETAINIAHSARLCKPYSSIFILDAAAPTDLESSLRDVVEQLRRGEGSIPHSVLVVDGQTLAAIDESESMSPLFYELVVLVSSVICCRASPSQKADLVQSIRTHVPDTMTLAVGDGANDIGMILASQVGIGISGREGLQAARISDFSVAQFRFLQKLILVHGRWNYLRTGRYILATFWKETFFYLVQAHFQRYNGYTGTSLYESWSLTVFNVLFTSLAVIVPGIFEQDLSADTLLSVPELYTFGQKNLGFNPGMYLGWVVMGCLGSVISWYPTWTFYKKMRSTDDTSLYAMGAVCFTVGVMFINIKLMLLEMHTKTAVVAGAFIITVGGWFMWLSCLSETFEPLMDTYLVSDTFVHNFGDTLIWWTLVLLGLTCLLVLELVVQAIRRIYFPTDVDIMQRIEKTQRKKGVSVCGAAVADEEPEDGAAAFKPEDEDLELQKIANPGGDPAPLQHQTTLQIPEHRHG